MGHLDLHRPPVVVVPHMSPFRIEDVEVYVRAFEVQVEDSRAAPSPQSHLLRMRSTGDETIQAGQFVVGTP